MSRSLARTTVVACGVALLISIGAFAVRTESLRTRALADQPESAPALVRLSGSWNVEALDSQAIRSEVERHNKQSERTLLSEKIRETTKAERDRLVRAMRVKYLSGPNDPFPELTQTPNTEAEDHRRLSEVDRSLNRLVQYAVYVLQKTESVAYKSKLADPGLEGYIVDLGWDFPGYTRRLHCANSAVKGFNCTELYAHVSDPIYVGRQGLVGLVFDSYRIHTIDFRDMSLGLDVYSSKVQMDYATFDPDSGDLMLRKQGGEHFLGRFDLTGKLVIDETAILVDDSDKNQIQNLERAIFRGKYVFQSGSNQMVCLDLKSKKILRSIETGSSSLSFNRLDRASGASVFFDRYPERAIFVGPNCETSEVFDFTEPIKTKGLDRPCEDLAVPHRKQYCKSDKSLGYQHWDLMRVSFNSAMKLDLLVCAKVFHGDPQMCWRVSQTMN